ncbi:peptidylprolyl isomerase [Pelagibacteraceae bacterium]|nr:peptidylprolyl isomerase [Pelagibacteraceae bacterium]
MTKYPLKRVCIFLIFFLNTFSVAAMTSDIIVKINNNIVTTYELKNKLKTSLVLSDQEINQENINKSKKQALDYLINLKVKKNELDKYKYEIDNIDVNKQLLFISSNDINNLKNKFKKFNLNYDLFLNELKIETGWKQLMFQIYNKKVKINQNDISKQVASYVNNNSKLIEYKISEIEIIVDENSEIEKQTNFIKSQIEEFGFTNTAITYSNSSTASNKGDIGWVNQDSLNTQIANTLKRMKIGDISKPIINLNNILFLKLDDKRSSKVEDLNLKELTEQISKQKENELFSLYSTSHLSKIKNNALIEYK